MQRVVQTLCGIVVLGWAAVASSGNCGGDIPCRCGDTVGSPTTLSADIGVCASSPALRIPAGSGLDCSGHTITGTGKGTSAWYGLLIKDAVGVEVKNCRVTGFKRGIRIDGGRDNRILNNESFGNWGYGIEVAGGSTGNLLQGNRVGKPSGVVRPDEGIHVGAGAHNTVIRDNVVIDSRNENIYILRSNAAQIISNDSSETDSASIFLKYSNGSYVKQNTVTKGSITVRGDSSGNVLEDNTISFGRGYLFEAHQDESNEPWPGLWTFPRRNTVIRGKVVAPVLIPGTDIRPCLRFEGAYKNQVDQLQLDPACTAPSQTADGGQESVGNVIRTIPLQ
jgi:parallel beta-helix repeat protein